VGYYAWWRVSSARVKKEECCDYKNYKDFENGDKISFVVKKNSLNCPLIFDSFLYVGFLSHSTFCYNSRVFLKEPQ
jgi:hypothetical protein